MEETLFLKQELVKNIEGYQFTALKRALNMDRSGLVTEIKRSGLKGRGGAGFPTGLKWELALKEEAEQKYIICNGDEGEPGTFKDRYLLEENPIKVLEGIMIAAYAFGADEGYIYIRGEYNRAVNEFKHLIGQARHHGLLGDNILDTGFRFNLHPVKGAGAYVCGDETSLINSIEGKRGRSRIKPPYPVSRGLFDRPTVVNNVETLAAVSQILLEGVDRYTTLGTKQSRGTKLVCLSGRVKNPGVYEVEFGQATLRQIINEFGGGAAGGEALLFVVPGGISTQVLTSEELDVPYTYEDLAGAGSGLGSGAVILVSEGQDLLDLMLNVSRFFMDETCGTCFPCREGNRQVYHLLEEAQQGHIFNQGHVIELIQDIGKTIHLAARCGLGQTSLNFINSVLEKYPQALTVKGAV